MANLETRVARIAQATLADQRFVRPIDILVGLGWLSSRTSTGGSGVALPRSTGACRLTLTKVAAALTALQRWAEDHGLTPSEVEYRELQFTTGADPDGERGQ